MSEGSTVSLLTIPVEGELKIFDGFGDVDEFCIAAQPVLTVDLTFQAI
jgi:hypothetical protein